MIKCPGCTAEVDPEQDFCMDCGEPIAGMKRAAPTQAAAPVVVPQSLRTTLPAKPAARRKRPAEEAEPVRCPGCGGKSLAQRCPGCGIKLRDGDE